MAGERLEVRSPFSGELLETLPLADREGALAAIGRARATHEAHPLGLSREERSAILGRAATLVSERAEAFASTIAREGGKPLRDARVEVTRAASNLRDLAGEAERFAGEEVPLERTAATLGRLAFTLQEPIGVVLAISAFNHPLNLIVHQVGTALAAGCPVVVKPALETPRTCLDFINLLYEAGAPPAWAQAVLCSDDVAEAMARDPRVAYLSFVGSAKVGWHLRRVVAEGTRVGLEHGGVAPVILDESADLELALPLVVRGAMYHAGQVCVSVQRILVHERICDELTARLIQATRALTVGDPRHADTDVGPLIRAREVRRVEHVVRQAVDAGARLLVGGERLGHQAFAPTLLADPAPATAVMTEEVFGPVAAIVPFSTLDQAFALANHPRLHFQSAIFTERHRTAMQAARALRASTVLINDVTTFRADWMPFGGHGESGLGLAGGPFGLRELSAQKLVVMRA